MKTKKLRVLLGPIHIAGDLLGYSKGLKSLGVENKIVITQPHSFGYASKDIELLPEKVDLNKVDIKVERGRLRGSFNLSNYKFLKFINKFDVFHFIFGHSFLPDHRDIPILKLKKKKIVVQFCGCDIRCREAIIKEKRKVSVCDECNLKCSLSEKSRLVNFWENYADAIISHPEYSQLLTRDYHLFIIGIDTQEWKPKSTPQGSKISIVHAPSMAELKGTKYIIEAVNLLKSERKNIEFILLKNLSNEQLKEKLKTADIVVDQVMCGWYGHFAVEAMALGKPVLAYIDKVWCEKVKYAQDVPILNTTKENVYENLKKLIDNAQLRNNLGQKSREYVEKVHDSGKVAKELLCIYESLYK